MASMMSAARNVSASSAASAVGVTGAVVTGAVVLTAVVGLVAGKATEGGIDFKKNSRLGSFRFDPSAMYSKFPAHRGLGCQPEYYYEVRGRGRPPGEERRESARARERGGPPGGPRRPRAAWGCGAD